MGSLEGHALSWPSGIVDGSGRDGARPSISEIKTPSADGDKACDPLSILVTTRHESYGIQDRDGFNPGRFGCRGKQVDRRPLATLWRNVRDPGSGGRNPAVVYATDDPRTQEARWAIDG